MGTADPEKARCLARRLAVEWDEVEMTIETVAQRQNLTVDEQRAIYRAALEKVIGLAIGDLVAPKKYRGDEPGMERIMAGYYAALLRVRADAEEVPDEIVDAAMRDEWNDKERHLVRKMLAAFGIPDEARSSAGEAALREIGAPISESTIHQARANVLRGMMEAHKRAELFNHPLIAAVGDPFAALLDDSLVLEARRAQLAEAGRQVTSTAPAADQIAEQAPTSLLFARDTEIRFSEQIDDLVGKMFADNKWKPDDGRTKHMLEAFAWLTGDKKMSDYEPEDADEFVRRMSRIPLGFKWGKLNASGGMAVPFSLSDFPEVQGKDRRADRTINSYLTKMEAAAKILRKSHWLPKQGFGQIMDFKDPRKKIEGDPSEPERVPLTEENLRTLYGLPLWQGGGGALKRLHIVEKPVVYQDAAYWVPLLGTYAGMSREEACGLELIDVEVEVETPYILVRENMTKTKDGVTPAGLKRKSRRRALPLHSEILRLGFADYVMAVRGEGRESLFLELYSKQQTSGDYKRWGKPGGPQFYARAWRGMIDACHSILPLPMTSGGKHADYHSQRTFHYSAMASEGVSEALLARHIGHSARTTGGKNYNRRALALGEKRELAERLEVLEREVPNVTGHVPAPSKVNLLHINNRSRVGSAKGRDASLYFLWGEDAILADKRCKAEMRKAARGTK
nr:hypothetical protein [Erythrobacter sp.]